MRPCGCLPSYIFLGQNCVKFYEVTKRPRLIQYFIALNVAKEFVLIYGPHPVFGSGARLGYNI